MQPIVTRKAAFHPHARVKRARVPGRCRCWYRAQGRESVTRRPCSRARDCVSVRPVCAGARFVHVRVLVCQGT